MHHILRQGKKLGTAIVGGVIILAGIIMIPYPGPGWLVVFAGLAILSTEFKFASKALEYLKKNKNIDIELKFIEPFESLADTKFAIIPEGSSQKVTWTMSGENNMISKWMCVFMGGMDGMIGKDFESGLASLKEKSEK